jgi:thioredoxin reductase (NADPH)
MTTAVLIVDDDRLRLDALTSALSRRYAEDYLILTATSAAAAVRHLTHLRLSNGPVALIMAAASMTTADGYELLSHARGLYPTAKRVFIVARGGSEAPSMRVPALLLRDRSVAQPVLRAMALGFVDSYLPAHASPNDERFHRDVSELLEEWAHTAAPDRPAVRIIGDDRSARSHELRDLLGRNSISYLFHPADSEEGRTWLETVQKTGSVLPVVVLYSGETLVDPTNKEIADAFGLGRGSCRGDRHRCRVPFC